MIVSFMPLTADMNLDTADDKVEQVVASLPVLLCRFLLLEKQKTKTLITKW